ncbi:SET domain protein, putative [Plasmodium vivax]|uniref:SET domain protein, putative n=1 Tax=Plasmodium vivax TaxID=5855 RepID=A0A1G4HF52_PLAVI|nr:SET domain protein, putative [Plasmodium vivax]
MKKERQPHGDQSEGIHDDERGLVSSKLMSIKENQDPASERWKSEKEATASATATASAKDDLRKLISYKNVCTLRDDGSDGHKTCHHNTPDDFQTDKKNFLSDSNTDFSKSESKGSLNANSPPTSYNNSINDNGKSRNSSKDSNRTNGTNRSKDKAPSCDDQKGGGKQESGRAAVIEIEREKRPKLKADEVGHSNRSSPPIDLHHSRPANLHHSRKKFLIEGGRITRSSVVKCTDFLNKNRISKTPSPKALRMKKQMITNVADDSSEVQKCKKKIFLKKLLSDGKTYHSDVDNSKRSSFFSCKYFQNFNKARGGSNFPLLLSSSPHGITNHHGCKKRVKKIHFANHSDNKIYSCSCNCDISCERNSYSDTYVIYSPPKKKGKSKSPYNILFHDKFVKQYQCNDREDKMGFPNSSQLYDSFFYTHKKKKRRNEISQGEKSRVRKRANCLPFQNYNFTLSNFQKRKKSYFHFRKNRKCRVKKKKGAKRKKRDGVGTHRLGEENSRMISPMEEGDPPKGDISLIEDKAEPHPNVMQSETGCKPTVCLTTGGEKDKGDSGQVDIGPPNGNTEGEQNAQQSSHHLTEECEEPLKGNNPEEESLPRNMLGEVNNQASQPPPTDSASGKDKNEMAEGPCKEIKITGKNFIKYDEEIFEHFYNDVHLKIGKIVTNKRKKYFLTYKIVKDSYFRILILNSEKLEKNILQAIAIQDVILYDKNVKIFSDPFYMRNGSKLYAVKFLKVFSLKYLKKIKKMRDIVFSDAEEGSPSVKAENSESAQLRMADEENAISTDKAATKPTAKETDAVEKDHLSKKEPTQSADEPQNGNLSEGTEANGGSGHKGAIKEDTQGEATMGTQKNAPEGSNMSDGEGGSGYKCSDNQAEEIPAVNNSSDNYDNVSNGGSRKLKKGTKSADKENPPKGTNKSGRKNTEVKEEPSSNETLPKGNTKGSAKGNAKGNASGNVKGNSSRNTKEKKSNADVKKKNSRDSPVKKKPNELAKNVNDKKSKKRNSAKVKIENEAGNKEEEEHNYTGIIYNDKKKFYFNVHSMVDIIQMVKGSQEKTKFHLDANNNNMKKKWRLFKKVEKTLFLENLVMDDEEVLFKRPKFFNCIIEESVDNYNVAYEAENGVVHLFENKLDRLKKKKGGNKTEADTSNKYIELKDEEKGFKYIGYRVSFELKKDNKKKSHFKTGIIKYYSPKYKQFFIHHIENFKCNGSVADSPKSTNREMGYTRGGSKSSATSPPLYSNSKGYHHPLAELENAHYGGVDQEIGKPISERQNEEGQPAEGANQNNRCIVRSEEEMMYLNYERRLDEENEKKKCDFVFSDVKGWYSPHFYNIKVLKTAKEFERFDILDKNDKRKELIDYSLLKKRDECSICKNSILFIKGHDHYTNSLSTIIYDLSSEMEKKEIDEKNMINVYWGIKCFICSKKFHAKCLDDEVIITKGYDKNVLMKEYKKYIYKNSLKKDKKCFKSDKEKGARSATKKEEKSKRVKKNASNFSDSKCTAGGGDSKTSKQKKNASGKRTTGSSKNGASKRAEDSSNDAVKEENEDAEEKSSKSKKKKGGKECTSQNENGKNNDSENDYKSDDREEQNKSDELNDEEDSDVEETNNCTKSKSKKSRKCINYVPAVKYNDISYKKFVCKDCYRCIYCCESIYNYKQTPNIANYVICKTCNMVAHGSCCFPNVPDIYLFNWKCDDCLKCNKCDYSNLCFINYNEWEFHLDCCINCYKEYEKKNFCIMCNEKYEIDDSNKWVQCDVCKFWIHLSCDKNENRNIETLSIKSINYKCPTCRSGSFHDKIERILYLFFLLDKYKNFTFHVPINFYIYWRIVKIPMNLYIMKKKIWEKKYSTMLEFLYDFFLIIHNAKTVHMPNTPIYKNACIFEKKGKVIIKNMFNLDNDELNKCIDDCLETYKKATNEETTNDNSKMEEEGKNYEGIFSSGGNKLTASLCNNSRDEILGMNVDHLSDRKNVTLDLYHSESVNHLGHPGIGKEVMTTAGEFAKLGFYPPQDGGIAHTGGNNHGNVAQQKFAGSALLNECSMQEGVHIPPGGVNNCTGRPYQSYGCPNADGTFESGIAKMGTNMQSHMNGTDSYNDYPLMERKNPMGACDKNPLDLPPNTDDTLLYNFSNNKVSKTLLNNNLLRKRKLEMLEKDITQYELHELFNFKSDSVFIHRNNEMFVPQSGGITNYNILTVNVKGKIYFNRSFDRFDEFDVCKIRKMHLLTGGSFSPSCGAAREETFSGENLQGGNRSSKEGRTTPLVDNPPDGQSIRENAKGEHKKRPHRGHSSVFVNENIFMIDIRKEKVKMNHVLKEETKIVNPVNNAYKFLKCVQMVFFGHHGTNEHAVRKNASSVGMDYVTTRVNYNSSDNESADGVTVERVHRDKGEAISLDDIISLMEGRTSKGGSKKKGQNANCAKPPNYRPFRSNPTGKKAPHNKIKLLNNDILKEYCHVCGCIEYKNPLVYCGACGVSLHYSCANISNPFLFNLAGYTQHRKEVNQIFNILTRNFKCNQCIKCDKCDAHFSDAVRETFYSNISSLDTSSGNHLTKKTTFSYFYNLKIEVVTLMKDKNAQRRKTLADGKALEFDEKGEVASPMISELNESPKNDQRGVQLPDEFAKVELVENAEGGESSPVSHGGMTKMEKQNGDGNHQQQGEKNQLGVNPPVCSKKRKKQNGIDVGSQMGSPTTTCPIADVKEESKTVQTNSEMELSPKKKKMSPKKKTTSSKKNEENEKVDQSAPNSIISILSVHDEAQRIIKCFCCGKSAHNECFYRIENSGESADKNDHDVHRKAVRTVFKRCYVKKNHSKKMGSPEKSEKGLSTANSGDYAPPQESILDSTVNEATLPLSKEKSPIRSDQIGEANTEERNNAITSSPSQENDTTTTTTETTTAAAMMVMVPPHIKPNTPKKDKLKAHLNSSHIVSEDIHTSVKCTVNRGSPDECAIQSTSININSKVECSIVSSNVTVLNPNETNASKSSLLKNELPNNGVIVIPADEIVRESLRGANNSEANTETVVINGKVYNKLLISEMYDVIRQKKNVKGKNFVHLFVANIDEAVMYPVLNEMLKGLHTYLNDKLNYYRLNKNVSSVVPVEHADKSKKEKHHLFDRKNLITDNNAEVKASEMLLKINALISETLSVPSNRKASNGKHGNRRSSSGCKKNACNDNPSERTMSHTRSEHFKGSNPTTMEVKNQENRTNETLLLATNGDNAFASPPYYVHCGENSKNAPIDVDSFGAYKMKLCSSASGGSHFDAANSGKSVPNFIDMTNVNDVSVTGVSGSAGLGGTSAFGSLGEHAEPKPLELTSRKNQNGAYMNKSIYKLRCKFNEKNIKKLTPPTGKNANGGYSAPNMNYSPIRKIIKLDKTNNVKMNVNSVSTFSECNSNVNDLGYMHGRTLSSPLGSVSNYSNVLIVNNTSSISGVSGVSGVSGAGGVGAMGAMGGLNSVHNINSINSINSVNSISNFNGENLCSSSSVSLQNVSVDGGGNLYNLISMNNNVNASNTVNIRDFLGNACNVNDINIVQNISILNNNNLIINVNGVEGKKEPFVNYSHLGNAGAINPMSSVINAGGMSHVNGAMAATGMSNVNGSMAATGMSNLDGAVPPGGPLFGENPTAHINSMNEMTHPFSNPTYAEEGENVYRYSDNMKTCNAHMNSQNMERMSNGRSYSDVINMKYVKNFPMNSVSGMPSNVANVFINEANFQPPPSVYPHRKVDYSSNEMSMEKNVYRPDLHNNEMNMFKNNYYFFNQGGNHSNSSANHDMANVNMPLDYYNPMRNGGNNFKHEMNATPFDGRMNNESFEMNRKIMINVSGSNEQPILYNDSGNFILHSKEASDVNRDGSSSSAFPNMKYGNISYAYEVRNQNKFSDLYSVYSKNVKQKDQAHTKTLLKSNIPNLDKFINSSRNRRSFPPSEKMPGPGNTGANIGGANVSGVNLSGVNAGGLNYNYNYRYCGSYNHNYSHNGGSFDPSVFKLNENAPPVPNVTERGNVIAPEFDAANKNPNFSANKLHNENVLNIRVEKNFSNNADHVVKDMQKCILPLGAVSKKCILYNHNEKKEIHINLCNEVKYNVQSGPTSANGEATEGAELASSKKRKLKFYCKNILIKKENGGSDVSGVSGVSGLNAANVNEVGSGSYDGAVNNNVSEQTEKKKKKGDNSASNGKECKKEKSQADQSATENGGQNKDARKKKRRDKSEQGEEAEKGAKRKDAEKGERKKAERKVAEKGEEKKTEKKAAEVKAAEKKATEKKAAEKKSVEKKAVEKAEKKPAKKVKKEEKKGDRKSEKNSDVKEEKKGDRKSEKNSDVKEEKKEMEEEKNEEKEKEKKKAKPKKSSKEEKQDERAEQEQEQCKDKAKETKRKSAKGEKCEKDSKATKAAKTEREKKRAKVKKEEPAQEGKKEGKEKKRVKGKDKGDEKKRGTKTNENAEEKEKKKASESRTTQVKTKKEANERKVDTENNNPAGDKLHELKGNSSSATISISSKFVCGSTYVSDLVPKNCSMQGRCKMDDSYFTDSDEELCLYSDAPESDHSTMNRGAAGSNRKRNRINKLNGFLKKNKFVLKSKFKRVTPNSYLCHSCVVLYRNDFSFSAFTEEVAAVEGKVCGSGNEVGVISHDNAFQVKKEINAQEGEDPVEQNSADSISKGVAEEGKEEKNPDGACDGVTLSANANNDGIVQPLCNPSACEEGVNVDAKRSGGDEGDEQNEATNLKDASNSGQHVDGAAPEGDEKNVPLNNTHDCRGDDSGSNNREDYFRISNERSGRRDPDWIFWMKKISAHNNVFFNRAYLKEKKATPNVRHFFETKRDVYKCSICCMICEYKIGKGDSSAAEKTVERTAEDESDNLNSLFLCNACSLRYGHIQKYTVPYADSSGNRGKTLLNLNRERSEKRKLHELVYFVIKMSYQFMYFKRNFFKSFCHLLDGFLRRNKSNVKLLYRLYFGNLFFKYDEFFPFFSNQVRRDDQLRRLFDRSGKMAMPFGSTHQHVLTYALDLFCMRMSRCSTKGKRKSSGATASVRVSLAARKLLFCYYKKGVCSGAGNGGSYFGHVVSYSVYFLHLYYLHKLHVSGVRKERMCHGAGKAGRGRASRGSESTLGPTPGCTVGSTLESAAKTVKKVRIAERKKRRKVNHNLFFKMKNTEAFAGALRALSQGESEWPILHRENLMMKKGLTTTCRSSSSSACKKGQLKEGKTKLFSSRSAKGAASLLLYEKRCGEHKRDGQNEEDKLGVSPLHSSECQKKVKQYVKKIKCTIKNKLNLYVKIMLTMYTQESLNMIKYQSTDEKKRLRQGNTKTCLLCHYGNYLYKGRLIPFYDIFIHSECLKWSLNCIQYYKLNSSSCECRSRIGKGETECKVNVKKNPSNDKKGARSSSGKRCKKKSAGSGSCSVKNEAVGGGTKESADRNSTHMSGTHVCNNHVCNSHLESLANKGDDPNGAGETRVKGEECCGGSQAGQQNPSEENLSKEKNKTEEIVNVRKSIKNLKLMDNFEWTENKNFFHNYEHIIEIDEDDVKEIIYDSINSTCFLCGYKNASIYCSNENCNIKFHLNCAFYSTMVKNSHQNIFFYYMKCFKLLKFNKDTIFYKYCHSSASNAEDKQLVQSLYEDIFPVHIIYKMKKVWCNKCWNAKRIYDAFYIDKENMQCSSRKEPSGEVEKVSRRPARKANSPNCAANHANRVNCTANPSSCAANGGEAVQGDAAPAWNQPKQEDTTTGELNPEREAGEYNNGSSEQAATGENGKTFGEAEPKRMASRKRINVMGSLRNIYKHFIHFYYENGSYYVMDQILYSINECVRIRYRRKPLNSVQEVLNKESKIESKLKHLESIINECANKNEEKSFVNDRHQLIFQRNVQNGEATNEQLMSRSGAHSTGDVHEESDAHANGVNMQNIIDNKNVENIFKSYFILKNFLYIGREITLKNEEYFFLKKKENSFFRYVYSNDEQTCNIHLPHVLYSNAVATPSAASRKETTPHVKDRSHRGNLPLTNEQVRSDRNERQRQQQQGQHHPQEPLRKICYATFIDDESEADNDNSENNLSSSSDHELDETDIAHCYGRERKDKQAKSINLYFELTNANRKVNITRLQQVSNYGDRRESSDAVALCPNADEKSEAKRRTTKGSGTSTTAPIGTATKKASLEQSTCESNSVTDKKESFLNMIISEKNDVFIKRTNEKLFANYKFNCRNNMNLSKCKVIKIGCHNILHMGDIVKYNGEKRIYPCGFVNMRIFFNLPSAYLFHIYKNAHIDDEDEKKKTLQRIFLQIRATYIFSITLKNQHFFFSIMLFPLISVDRFSVADAQKFVLAESHDIGEVYAKFLSLFKFPNGDLNNGHMTDAYRKYVGGYSHLLQLMQSYIFKSVQHNVKAVDPHDFFGLTLPCVIYQMKYKLFKYIWKNVNHMIRNYIRRYGEREEFKKRVKNCTREVIYNDNLLCKYSNLDTSIFKENEKEKEKNMRKTVKYKYNINSAMSYRYLMNISSNSRLYVKKSSIHGYGLYTCEFINEGEPVIEYIGEYIRNIISDKREKYYDKIESSCYMFRLNENIIIDATKWGNVSRFINHSCEPNCFCKIVSCDQNLKHIVIFAKRDIVAHEEITYDYQFGVESEGKKLICLCGSSTCLGRMN